eukprot:15365420-Ditylum_brightwellii.AAC.1
MAKDTHEMEIQMIWTVKFAGEEACDPVLYKFWTVLFIGSNIVNKQMSNDSEETSSERRRKEQRYYKLEERCGNHIHT